MMVHNLIISALFFTVELKVLTTVITVLARMLLQHLHSSSLLRCQNICKDDSLWWPKADFPRKFPSPPNVHQQVTNSNYNGFKNYYIEKTKMEPIPKSITVMRLQICIYQVYYNGFELFEMLFFNNSIFLVCPNRSPAPTTPAPPAFPTTRYPSTPAKEECPPCPMRRMTSQLPKCECTCSLREVNCTKRGKRLNQHSCRYTCPTFVMPLLH